MRLPDFLGIGTQKGGTTFLHRLLQQHPQVWMAHPKELQYFSLHHARGFDWYANHFAGASPEQCCGEVTPYYLFHPLAAERIHAAIPKAKLIVLLRDPVERALSQYFHSRRLGFETLDLEEAFAKEPERLADADAALQRGEPHLSHQQHSYLSRSRYEQQLPRFREVFRPAQLLVLRSEDLFEQPKRIWEQVIDFLGLMRAPCPDTIFSEFYGGNGESLRVARSIKKQLMHKLNLSYVAMQQQYQMSWRRLD